MNHFFDVKHLSISLKDYLALLRKLDESYLQFLSRYFNLNKAQILNKEGCIPAAENGSEDEERLEQLNRQLWQTPKL